MTASAWVALSSLAFASLVQLVGVVIWLTRLDMRMKGAESSILDMKGTGERLVRIEAEMSGLRDDVRAISAGLDWLRTVPGYTPPAERKRA